MLNFSRRAFAVFLAFAFTSCTTQEKKVPPQKEKRCSQFGSADYAVSLQSRFAREVATFSCFKGPTSEASCSGTGLAVYLSGNTVQHLDWTLETSSQFIRRQYYFDGPSPCLVVESLHAKLDLHAEPLGSPRLVSTQHYWLNASQSIPRQKELLDQAKILMDDFKKHRANFAQTQNRNG